MTQTTLELPTEEHTAQLGNAIGAQLRVGDVILLSGPLGAGKTTLARSVIASRISVEDAPSPTFTLVEAYQGKDIDIWHFDLYRLEAPEEVWELGIEDAFHDGASIIEWPERASGQLPKDVLRIELSATNCGRQATFYAAGSWTERLAKIADTQNQTINQ